MRTPRRLFIGCLAAVALIALLPAALVDAAPAKVAEVSIGAGAVAWQPQIDRYKSLTLFIAGPSGSTVHEFETGRVPVFTLVGGDGVRHPDGVYKWELRATPQLDEATRDALARDRAEGAGTFDGTASCRRRTAGRRLPVRLLRGARRGARLARTRGDRASVGGRSSREHVGRGQLDVWRSVAHRR